MTYHERSYSTACRDLNELFFPYRIAREALEIEGKWQMEDLREECKEQTAFYNSLAKKAMAKWQAEGFSPSLIAIAGKGLPAIAKLYKQMAAQQKKLLRNIKNLSLTQTIEVKLEESFKKKMERARKKYGALWLLYKEKYIPKEYS